MRWRVLTALVLILAILVGGMTVSREVKGTCREIESLLQQAKGDPRPDLLEQACALWERRLPLLSCVVTHDRLERVGEGLARAKGYLTAGEWAAFTAQNGALLYLLDDIREYDHINIQTLL